MDFLPRPILVMVRKDSIRVQGIGNLPEKKPPGFPGLTEVFVSELINLPDLVFQFVRFVRDFLPRAVLFENVPRLAKDGRFEALVEELRKLGYETKPAILNAADFGVPQRRRRLILLGSRGKSPKLLKDSGERKSVRETIGDLPAAGSSGDSLHDWPEERSEKVRRLIARIPRDGGSRTDLPAGEQLDCHKRCDGFKDVYGRMAWDQVAPTITSGCVNPSKGRWYILT